MSDKRKFAERLANGIMTWPIKVGRWDGSVKLPEAARKAAKDAGANPDCFNGYLALLGKFHSRLKEVKAAYAKVRNLHRRLTIALTNGDEMSNEDRGIINVMYPAALKQALEEVAKADAIRDKFLTEYDRLVQIAKAEDLGSWKKEAASKYPTASELRSKFYVRLGTPKPLADYSPERLAKMNVTVEIAEQIAEQGMQENAGIGEAALEHVIGLAEMTMNRLAKAQRFTQSMIDDAKLHSTMLRELVQSYNHEPRLLKMAKMMEDKIVSVKQASRLAQDETLRAQAKETAAGVRDMLRKYRKQPTGQAAAPAPKPTVRKGKVKAGGIVGKKLSKAHASP